MIAFGRGIGVGAIVASLRRARARAREALALLDAEGPAAPERDPANPFAPMEHNVPEFSGTKGPEPSDLSKRLRGYGSMSRYTPDPWRLAKETADALDEKDRQIVEVRLERDARASDLEMIQIELDKADAELDKKRRQLTECIAAEGEALLRAEKAEAELARLDKLALGAVEALLVERDAALDETDIARNNNAYDHLATDEYIEALQAELALAREQIAELKRGIGTERELELLRKLETSATDAEIAELARQLHAHYSAAVETARLLIMKVRP